VDEDDAITDRLPESVAVEEWRMENLLAAGYELGAAERLSRSPVDLHAAVKLAQDAGPRLAAEILT
jgi:hypothetical protein